MSQAKFTGNQKTEMNLATEFVAQKTLNGFYEMFNADVPQNINKSFGYATMTKNYISIIDKLGVNENHVVGKVRNHIINGEWEDQRNGLVNALNGAEVNEKNITTSILSRLVDAAILEPDYRFERNTNKMLDL